MPRDHRRYCWLVLSPFGPYLLGMRNLQLLAAAFVVAAAPAALRAQDTEQKVIIAVVEKLFTGMRTKDTATMRSLFVPAARMLGVRRDTVRADPIDGWLNSIGRSASVLNERTWGYEVKVDGDIAQAWMQYDLLVNDRFQHCGVDAFDLIKIAGAWKIVTVMDSRRTTGCTPPPGKH
jgi:hypothetical protein